MNCDSTDPGDGVSRRAVLAAGATGLVLPTSGCVDRVESAVDQEMDRLALSITTVPADGDREAVRIARELEANLEDVGVDASIDMRSRSEFLETILIDRDFDLYVGRHPAGFDPDFLYEALHSAYANEAGWQNPFGFANIPFDDALEAQRRADGDEREAIVADLLETLAEEKPFDPICFPEEHRVARTDRFEGWSADHPESRHGYLGLEPAENVDRLRVLVTDSRISRNLNPLSATLRERGSTIDLVYDSLATEHDGELVPWLAEDVTLERADADDDHVARARITLREDCRFHDDEPVRAEDVAFTYRFLEDTSLGRAEFESPPPRYRGHATAVDTVDVEDDRELRLGFAAGVEAARRALTVPILPAHRWRDQIRSRAEDTTSFTATQGEWGLVTMDNVPPVGSGPFRFESNSEREHLTLERFDDHFTRREDVDLPAVGVEQLQFGIDPGSASSIERVANDGADFTASMLEAHALDSVPDEPDVDHLAAPSRTFYHVGYNTRAEPFSNPHARRIVSRLLDPSWIVDAIFDGHATPTAAPLPEEWVPDELGWDGQDPATPFFGSDGDLDVETARAALESAGYQYDDQGRLRL
ncbi:ABC transporter substrate-binding protein [Natronococcus occultus]|uniref:Family 5 extracellular solute-binding protein n=1 Tax=Natronococcus occultus SP4 TaxID=694430 RepID=L0JXR5_9EURY|nr:ABC transporter substrate-binding protein [Natronococcus occultus]AGB36894.1 family 5 extracellular solute-binding protein [Natronococcus occultus SP4]